MSSTPPPAVYVPEPYQPRLAASRVDDPTVIGLETYVAQVVEPARRHKRRVRLTLLTLVLLAAAAIASWQLGFEHGTSRPTTVPVGSGVTPGAPTDPPVGPGNVYRSTAGHYAARFLGLPTEASRPGAAGGLLYTLHAVVDDSSGSFVESSDLYPGIAPREVDSFLRGLVAATAGPRGLAVAENKATTFHGRPAQTVRLVDATGHSVTLLAVAFGTRRFYLLGAESGSAFTLLKDSFVALP
jgi:hypothetical protein